MTNPTTAFIHPWFWMGEVELGRRPSLNIMAGFALSAKGSCMESGVLMTTHTSCRKSFVGTVRVALIAFHIGMPTRQWEVRTAVIEIGILPTGYIMARLAI